MQSPDTFCRAESGWPPKARESISVAHVISSVDVPSAGPSYSVPAICRSLAANGAVVELMSAAHLPEAGAGATSRDGYLHRRVPLDWPFGRLGGLFRSRAMTQALRASPVEIMHAHGLWQMPLISAGRVAAARQLPLVVTPRGMLHKAALAFSSRKKAVFDALLQRRVLTGAAVIHATSEEECGDARRYGFDGALALVPNGVDIPDRPVAPASKRLRRVITVGRIHPKKGLDRLLRAWARVEDTDPEATLEIVGPDENGHRAELEALVARLGLSRATIGGPVYGSRKTELYARSAVFVLPTQGENFAMTVAESLAAGTPVISTKGAPWEALARERCGWWIDHGAEAMADAILAALALPDAERVAMGARGRAYMERDFSWTVLAERMLEAYLWTLGRGARPACIVETARADSGGRAR